MKISTSKIRCFKECRKKFYFRYIEKIERPKSEALIIGTTYHEGVANILTGKPFDKSPLLDAFNNYMKLPAIKEVEKPFEIDLSDDLTLVGFIDAVTVDGLPVEHKTTRLSIDDKYKYKLNWDEQVTTYLVALTLLEKRPITKMIYTACQKPSIRQKKTETIEEFNQRVLDWFDETKITSFAVVRSINDLKAWHKELILMGDEIKSCTNYYRNPSACSLLGCEYSGICLDYEGEVSEVCSNF